MKIDINSYPLHYDSRGHGRPLFIFPGWTICASEMAYITESVFEMRTGWQRIYIDPPGHGYSPASDDINNLDDMLELIVAAVDQLADGRSFALYGLSLGAYLARGIIYHRFHMVNGLMMVVPVILPDNAYRDVPQHTVIYEEPGIMQQLKKEEKEMFSMAVVRSKKFLQSMRDIPQPAGEGACDMDFLATIRENRESYKCSFDVDALANPFPGPALIITGRQDATVGYKDAWNLLEKYPRASYVIFDRASHFMEEKNELIIPLFHDWLDRVEEYDE